MLHLWLLKTAQNHPLLVELKNGEAYNGHLVSCDNWMNTNLREVICKSRDRDNFWLMPECYIRSSTIKYLRIPNEIIDTVKEEVAAKGRGRGGLQQKRQKGHGTGGCWARRDPTDQQRSARKEAGQRGGQTVSRPSVPQRLSRNHRASAPTPEAAFLRSSL